MKITARQKILSALSLAVIVLFSGCPNLGETLERDKNTLKILYDRSEGSIRYNGSMVWTSPLEKYPRPDSFTLEAVPAKSEGYWFDSFRLGEAIWGGTDYVITIEENPFVADFTSGTLRGDINRIEVVFHRFVFEWTAPVGDGSGDLYSIASRTNKEGSNEYRLVRIDADGELDALSKARFIVVADLDIGGISSAQKVAGGVFLQDSVSKDCFVVRLSSADVLERELIYGAELEKQYGTVIGAAHDTSRFLVWNIEEAWSGVSDFVSYGIYDYRAAEGERYTEVCTRPYENGEDFDWDRSALPNSLCSAMRLSAAVLRRGRRTTVLACWLRGLC